MGRHSNRYTQTDGETKHSHVPSFSVLLWTCITACLLFIYCLLLTQGKLEEVVEMLAQVVNRPYLLTPQAKISETARNVDYLCEEYLAEMREVARAATETTLEVKQDPKPKR